MRGGMVLDWGSRGWSFPALHFYTRTGPFFTKAFEWTLTRSPLYSRAKGALYCRQADMGNSLAVFILSWAGGLTPFCCKTDMAWETLQMGLNARSPGLSVTNCSHGGPTLKFSLNRAFAGGELRREQGSSQKKNEIMTERKVYEKNFYWGSVHGLILLLGI